MLAVFDAVRCLTVRHSLRTGISPTSRCRHTREIQRNNRVFVCRHQTSAALLSSTAKPEVSISTHSVRHQMCVMIILTRHQLLHESQPYNELRPAAPSHAINKGSREFVGQNAPLPTSRVRPPPVSSPELQADQRMESGGRGNDHRNMPPERAGLADNATPTSYYLRKRHIWENTEAVDGFASTLRPDRDHRIVAAGDRQRSHMPTPPVGVYQSLGHSDAGFSNERFPSRIAISRETLGMSYRGRKFLAVRVAICPSRCCREYR